MKRRQPLFCVIGEDDRVAVVALLTIECEEVEDKRCEIVESSQARQKGVLESG